MIINFQAGERKNNGKRYGSQKKIEQVGQNGSHRKNLSREVYFRYQVEVPDETVCGKTYGGDKERIRKGFNHYGSQFGKLHRFSGHNRECLVHKDSSGYDKHGHKYRPQESHDRLLISDFDIPPRKYIHQIPVLKNFGYHFFHVYFPVKCYFIFNLRKNRIYTFQLRFPT